LIFTNIYPLIVIMKKLLLVGLIIVSMRDFSLAQMQKGDILTQAGLGFGTTRNYTSYHRSISINLAAEYMLNPYLSAGLQVDMIIKTFYFIPYNLTPAAAVRSSFRFGKLLRPSSPYDLYIGGTAGYHDAGNEGSNSSRGTGWNNTFWGAYIGTRYFFKPRFGIFAEAGYNITYLKAGATIKF
jgi:hypothetical protein